MIVLKNVSKYFGRVRALDGVSFEVGKGEVVGFLGPNGAGKTTTMRLITGYFRPTKGRIRVGGVDPGENRVEAVKKIGYLPENNPLYVNMKVSEYLAFVDKLKTQSSPARSRCLPALLTRERYGRGAPSVAGGKLKATTQNSKLEDITKVCGIGNKIDQKIEELSRGYKQRVGIAAAILGDPQVLIMDEPTSGLDPNQVVEIRDLVKKLGEEKTVILSTHILQEVEAMCNRVIIINKGKIVWDGEVPKRKGRLEKIFREVTIGK